MTLDNLVFLYLGVSIHKTGVIWVSTSCGGCWESSWVNKCTNIEVEMAAITAIILSKLVSPLTFLFMAALPVACWSSERLFGLWLFLFSLEVCCTECKCCCGNKRELQSLKTAACLIRSINCFNKQLQFLHPGQALLFSIMNEDFTDKTQLSQDVDICANTLGPTRM